MRPHEEARSRLRSKIMNSSSGNNKHQGLMDLCANAHREAGTAEFRKNGFEAGLAILL